MHSVDGHISASCFSTVISNEKRSQSLFRYPLDATNALHLSVCTRSFKLETSYTCTLAAKLYSIPVPTSYLRRRWRKHIRRFLISHIELRLIERFPSPLSTLVSASRTARGLTRVVRPSDLHLDSLQRLQLPCRPYRSLHARPSYRRSSSCCPHAGAESETQQGLECQ